MKILTCAQSKAVGTRTKFKLEILITSTICAIHKFRGNFLESSRNVSETTPRHSSHMEQKFHLKAAPPIGLNFNHYSDVIMDTMAFQITSLAIVYLTVYSEADQRNHQSSASLAFVRGIHRWPVNSPHKWPVTRKMFPFDDVIMCSY